MRSVMLGVQICLLDLRLPAGAVRVTAPTACASAPRSVAVFNLYVAITGARLNTVRVILDKVVDIIVEIRVVGLPVVALLGCSTADTVSYMHRVAMLRVHPEE